MILLLLTQWGISQQYSFQTYSIDNGLPQSEVFNILSDSRGYLWLTTNGGGVCQYNGTEFKTYTINSGLIDDQIKHLFESSDSSMYFLSSLGMSVYDGISFANFNTNSGYPEGYRYKMVELPGQDLLIYVRGDNYKSAIYKFDNKTFSLWSNQYSPLFEDNFIIDLFVYEGVLYIATINGLYTLENNELKFSEINNLPYLHGKVIRGIHKEDDKTWILMYQDNYNNSEIGYLEEGKFIPLKTPDKAELRFIDSFKTDRFGHKWFIAALGVARYDGEKWDLFTEKNGLPNNLIASIATDIEGNIWFGTSGKGITKFNGERFISFNSKDGLRSEIVRTIYRDRNGNMWFGTAGEGITRYNGQEMTYFFNNLPNHYFFSGNILESSKGGFYYATSLGLKYFNGRNFVDAAKDFKLPQQTSVKGIFKIEDTHYILPTTSGIYKYKNGQLKLFTSANSKLSSNRVQYVHGDNKGNIYVCTDIGVDIFEDDDFSPMQLGNLTQKTIVLQAATDKAGNTWFATFGNGVFQYNGNGFAQYSVNNGLSSNSAYSIIADKDGNIWVGAQSGIDRILISEEGIVENIKHFGKNEGFSGGETNGASAYLDQEGNLWFGTINGVTAYKPHKDYTIDKEPITKIKGLSLFTEEQNWSAEHLKNFHNGLIPWTNLPKNLHLPHHLNHLSFQLEAINYRQTAGVKYSWKLDGYDSKWSPVSEKALANYPNLQPGSYTFHLKACNSDGVWTSQPVSYQFSIKKPYYATWWFILLNLIALVGIVMLIFQIRLRRIKANKRELEILVEKKTAEIKEQNDEIIAQNEELEQQREEILAQTEHLKESYSNLALLSEIGKDITNSLSSETIIEKVYANLNTLMDASVFGIGIYDKDSDAIQFSAIRELGSMLAPLTIPLNTPNSLAVKCFKNQQEVFINNCEHEYQDYVKKRPMLKAGMESKSIIYAPLTIGDKKMGVITVQSPAINAYSQYHLNIIRNLSIYTAIAFDNAYVYEEMQQKTINLAEANKELNRAYKDNEQKNKELELLNDEKNKLISIVAHDLRNPLTASITTLDILKLEQNKMSDTAINNLKHLNDSLWRMNAMIDKILDIRAIENSSYNIQPESLNLSVLVQEVAKSFDKQAKLKHIQLKTYIESPNLTILADKAYMVQILENLLSNAIKFSPKHDIIDLKLESDEDFVRCSIKDRGPGFTAEEMQKLFKVFQKFSARPTANEKSTGLGLSIVKKYTDAMDGKVWCESTAGQGAKFIVEFDKINN